MAEGMRRETGINFAVRPDEHKVIRTAAGIKGQTLSGYLRTEIVPRSREVVEEYIDEQIAGRSAADGSGEQAA